MNYNNIGKVFKLLYGYHVENEENVPRDGPFILLYNEYSIFCTLAFAVASGSFLSHMYKRNLMTNFLGEEVWLMPGISTDMQKGAGNLFPLLNFGSAPYAFRLIDGLKHLQQGRGVIINPEGDMSRDGRPLPVRNGAAWLGLHSGAPMVPMNVSSGVYDIWAPWRQAPSLGGRAFMRVGKPFKVTETPLAQVHSEDLRRANQIIGEKLHELYFGPGGAAEWAGPALCNGEPVGEEHLARLKADPTLARGKVEVKGKSNQRGAALLLWRCPVCHANDGPAVQRGLPFAPATIRCQACGAAWRMRRAPGHDFRLELVAGPPEWRGLDLPLSGWHDLVRRDFAPRPLPAGGLVLEPGEEVYLHASDAALSAPHSGGLFKDWQGLEPPTEEFPKDPTDWGDVAKGRLSVTNRRMVWQGPAGPLSFYWSHVKRLGLRSYFLLGVTYGKTPYRLTFTAENGLKVLTYAGTVLKQVAASERRPVEMTPF